MFLLASALNLKLSPTAPPLSLSNSRFCSFSVSLLQKKKKKVALVSSMLKMANRDVAFLPATGRLKGPWLLCGVPLHQ